MKIYHVISIFLIVFIISGCSSKGMMTAGHNGKKYWNPGNCSQFKYNRNDPDTISCVTDGELNGTVLNPVGQQQLDNYYQEQKISKTSSSSNNNSNIVSCYKFGDLSRRISQFNGMFCPYGYMKAF